MATKKTPDTNTALKIYLPLIAKDVSAIKLNISILTKMFEADRKAQAIAKQRQRADEYGAKFKRATPSRTEKKVVSENKKSFFETIKEGLEGLFKFALIGLAAIGITKLLSSSGVMEGIAALVKKMLIGISDVLQKGMSFIGNIIQDNDVIQSIFNLTKKLFKFIADGIVGAANFFSSFVSDPANQETLKNVVVAIISGIVNAVKAVFAVGKDLLSENSAAIKEGAISVFLVIKDIIVGTLKGAQTAIQDPRVKAAIMDITNAVLNLIGQIMNTEAFEVAGQKITIKQALIGFGVAVAALGLSIYALRGYFQGLGQKSITPGGKPGTGSSRGRKSGMGFGLGDVLTFGALGYGTYEFFKDEKTQRPTNTSPQSIPTNDVSTNNTSTRPYPVNSVPNENRPIRVAPMMPKSLEEYVDMEFDRKKAREGFRNKAYASPEGGTDTVGIGHKLTDKEQTAGGVFIGGRLVKVDRNTPLTDDQVKELYRQDIMKHAAAAKNQVNKLAGQDVWSGLNPMQQYALMDLSFAGGPGMITKDLADAIRSGDMNRAAQIIQQKARTYRKNGVMVESKHHAKHADLRSDIFRGYDPLLTGETTTASAQRPNSQPTMLASTKAFGSMEENKDSGHAYSPSGGADVKEEPKSIMDTFMSSLSEGLVSLDKATGGKLGFASDELQSLLRDKSFLSAFESPMFADMSKSMNVVDNVAIDEKTPSVYDEVLLSKLARS